MPPALEITLLSWLQTVLYYHISWCWTVALKISTTGVPPSVVGYLYWVVTVLPQGQWAGALSCRGGWISGRWWWDPGAKWVWQLCVGCQVMSYLTCGDYTLRLILCWEWQHSCTFSRAWAQIWEHMDWVPVLQLCGDVTQGKLLESFWRVTKSLNLFVCLLVCFLIITHSYS